MIELLLMLFIGILFLCFALFALGRGSSANTSDYPESEAELERMLRLPGLEFDSTNLLSDADYRFLASEPRLRSVARELWKDRKNIALQWLRQLQRDIFTMWRFRAFLTRLGVTATVGSELSEAVRSLLLLSLLSSLRLSVKILGPYSFGKIAASLRTGVEKTNKSCAAILANLPPDRWPQIAAAWQRAQVI